MSVAAPRYLGQDSKDFSEASPALRFGLYLDVWDPQAWIKMNKDVSKAIQKACPLSKSDQGLMAAYQRRQDQAFDALPSGSGFRVVGRSVAPFATGLGNEHPTENGFAFLHPYGLPYLAGSGVKGVLRQAVRELMSEDWGSKHWSPEARHGKDRLWSDVDVLLGSDSADDQEEALRGVLSFWDVLPVVSSELKVEIMTPHQSHYYQRVPHAGSASPHDSGKPNPILFLCVPSGSEFTFRVSCDWARLKHLAPALAEQGAWKLALAEAFEHAFGWLGFGAKTAVGYGEMQRSVQAEAKLHERAQSQELQKAREKLTPQARSVEEFVEKCQHKKAAIGDKGRKDKPNTELHQMAKILAQKAAEEPQWTAQEKKDAAQAIETWLPQVVDVDIKDASKKMKLNALKQGPAAT